VPATGKPVTVNICNVIELFDGKVYREREYMDTMSIMTQIGAVSLPAKQAGR
jgi:ketosteroid isomerase-like protein